MTRDRWLDRLRWTFRWWLARWRARLAFRGDTTTAAARLAAGRALPGPLSQVDAGPALPPPEPPAERDDEFRSFVPSPAAITGRGAPTFRLASTRMLPPPLRDLAVFRAAAWPLDAVKPPEPPDTGERPAVRALALARQAPVRHHAPALDVTRFGLDPDATTSRLERAPAPVVRGPVRPSLRINLAPAHATRLERPTAGAARPEVFGLDEDFRLPTEANALPARLPLPLSPARANFRARWVDPVHKPEEAGLVVPESFGERVRTKLAPKFATKPMGASGAWREKERDASIGEAMEQVHEQFLLRRDVPKMDEPVEDLVGKASVANPLGAPIKAFTGLEFMDLQPTPVKALQMRLERPPPDMAPFVEPTMQALAELVRTVREHPDAPPPVPEVARTP